MTRAQEFVRDSLAPPRVEPAPVFVQMNHTVRADVAGIVDTLAENLGWPKVKVVSTAIRMFELMVAEEQAKR